VVDETRDVAVHGRVPAPVAVHAKHPDAALVEIEVLAPGALLVRDQLTGILNDALVLVNGLASKTP
jgi:hypothetical protein